MRAGLRRRFGTPGENGGDVEPPGAAATLLRFDVCQVSSWASLYAPLALAETTPLAHYPLMEHPKTRERYAFFNVFRSGDDDLGVRIWFRSATRLLPLLEGGALRPLPGGADGIRDVAERQRAAARRGGRLARALFAVACGLATALLLTS